jgi:uncharacterized protein (DUF362 family)
MKRMDRRTFLVRSATAGLGIGVLATVGLKSTQGSPRPWDERSFASPRSSRVAVLHASSYDTDLVGLLTDAIRDSGVEPRGKSVLLKPNLVEYDAGSVINTDPRLVAAAALAFRRLGARSIVVGEGPGHRRDTAYVVRRSGLWDALKAVDVPFTDLNTEALVETALHSSYTKLGTLWLPRVVAEADLVVSMPKMKTHHWAGVTLSLKNCFGCVPGRVYGWPKNVLHLHGIENSILDVAGAVRPDLAIIDGIVGMEGDGPIKGTAKAAGVLVVSSDLVAADATAARLMGFEPERVAYLREAGRFLGQVHLEEIKQIGEDLERSATSFRTLPAFDNLHLGSQRRSNTTQAGSA